MAPKIPTITTIVPNAGYTRGTNVVAITGTNFALPAAPDPDGYLGGPAPRSVSVKFDGVESPSAQAASATLIYAVVPTLTGTPPTTWPLLQDVRVANLDDDEDEVALENVTKPDAYAMTRPELSARSMLVRLNIAVIQLLKRHVIANVALTQGRDYDDDPATWERLRASTPALLLSGPILERNRDYGFNREDDEAVGATQWLRRREPVTVDLAYDVRGLASSPVHLGALGEAFMLALRDVQLLALPAVPGVTLSVDNEYEIEIVDTEFPRFDAAPNTDDLYMFDARILVRGVHLDDDSATVIERGWRIASNDGAPVLDVQEQ
jgi:hypothetical protein